MKEIKYLDADAVMKINLLVLSVIKAKKSDKAEVLSQVKIEDVLKNCREAYGNLYDKAAVLMEGFVKAHAFASGNRRTAFLAAKRFIIMNRGKMKISDDAENAKVFIGIRENYYELKEIKEWIKNGKIRSFRR